MKENCENRALELMKSDPCRSYNSIAKETGISSRRLSELAKENNIERMTRKDYVANYLKDHPFYTYAIVEENTKYGQGNIARLAKKMGYDRNPHEITTMRNEEIISLYQEKEDFNRDIVKNKYGVSDSYIQEIIDKYLEEEEKANKVSYKDEIIELLKNSNLDYTNIATIVGCDLGYVSRLAKAFKLQRDCSFAEALENNIRYYLSEDNGMSYEEIRQRLNRCQIDKVIDIAKEMNVERDIVPNEDEIVMAWKSGMNVDEISDKYNYTRNIIDLVAIKHGFIEHDSEKDKLVIEMLQNKTTCTYLEISNTIGYNYSLVKEVAEQNGYKRNTIDYGGKNKDEIITLLKNNPKMTYKEIGRRVGRSQHTIWRIAKENNLGHNRRKSAEA